MIEYKVYINIVKSRNERQGLEKPLSVISGQHQHIQELERKSAP